MFIEKLRLQVLNTAFKIVYLAINDSCIFQREGLFLAEEGDGHAGENEDNAADGVGYRVAHSRKIAFKAIF